MDASQRMENMNEEILAYVRGDKRELVKTKVNLNEYLENFIKGIKSSYQEQKVEINIKCSSDLEIEIDKEKMLRVIMNIFSNAKEAMPSGGSINIDAKVQNGQICLNIGDTGSGMPEEIRKNIFKPFVTYGKKNGTGLGMAITKNILDKHGAHVEIISEENVGTTFHILLPNK